MGWIESCCNAHAHRIHHHRTSSNSWFPFVRFSMVGDRVNLHVGTKSNRRLLLSRPLLYSAPVQHASATVLVHPLLSGRLFMLLAAYTALMRHDGWPGTTRATNMAATRIPPIVLVIPVSVFLHSSICPPSPLLTLLSQMYIHTVSPCTKNNKNISCTGTFIPSFIRKKESSFQSSTVCTHSHIKHSSSSSPSSSSCYLFNREREKKRVFLRDNVTSQLCMTCLNARKWSKPPVALISSYCYSMSSYIYTAIGCYKHPCFDATPKNLKNTCTAIEKINKINDPSVHSSISSFYFLSDQPASPAQNPFYLK